MWVCIKGFEMSVSNWGKQSTCAPCTVDCLLESKERMNGGKKKTPCADPLLSSNPPVSSASSISAAGIGGGDATGGAEGKFHDNQEEREKVDEADEPCGEKEGGEEDSGANDDNEQLENLQIVDAEMEEEPEGDRVKLAEGFYEIESVRRKRVRKGQVQYFIKWRGWSEAANTWEPLDNLLQCSDIVDAYEERLKTGRGRPSRKRKRQSSSTHVQNKKKLQLPKQKLSSADATYSIPSHVMRIDEDPAPYTHLNDTSSLHDSGDVGLSGGNSIEISRGVIENGSTGMVSVSREEENESELNLKLCELKGVMALSMQDSDKYGSTSEQGQPKVGHVLAKGWVKDDATDVAQSGRCTGAKKRKSGSVKRFKQDTTSYDLDNSKQIVTCDAIEPVAARHPDCVGNYSNYHNKYADSKAMYSIMQIVKPISYKSSISNNVQDVLVAFEALRSDGSKVTVDNKFLKANNPLLLIDFYEKHLRYSPT